MVAEQRRTTATPNAVPQRSVADRISWQIVAITTICLPLVFSSAVKDSFRLPKELLLRASGIVLITVAACEIIIAGGFGRKIQWPRALCAVLAAVLIWSVVATFVSTNRPLSIFSLLTVVTAAAFFLATFREAASRPLSALYIGLVPAVVNAVIAIAQRTEIWNPLTLNTAYTGRLATTAFLGNPNDVGMFLVTPMLASAVLALTSTNHRLAAIGITGVLAAGLLASETLGAIVAVGAGIFVLLLMSVRTRVVLVAGIAVLLLAIAFVRLSPDRWAAAQSKIASAAHGDIDPLLSGRLPAFFAAWRMLRAHPIFGVGPGCFAFHYFDEKIAVEMEHPWLLNRNVVNFGEAHNEHLQILAEAGLPGYGIFIAALLVLARISFRKIDEDSDARSVFAQRIALPLAVAIFTLTLSSFPLRLAAPTANALFFCAITMAWGGCARSR